MTNIKKFQVEDGKFAWSMKSDQCVEVIVETVKALLAKDSKELKSGARSQKSHSHLDINLNWET